MSIFMTNAISSRSKHSICILGAGPSGLFAALELKTKWYPVVVLERTGRKGGKCRTYKGPDGLPYEQGAIIVGNYSRVRRIITLAKFTCGNFTFGKYAYDYEIGEAVPVNLTAMQHERPEFWKAVHIYLDSVSDFLGQ